MRSTSRSWIPTFSLLLAFSSLASSPASATGQLEAHSSPLPQDKVSLSIARALNQPRNLRTLLEHSLPNERRPWKCGLGLTLSRVRTTNQCALEADAPPRPQCIQLSIDYSCRNL
jgi:hypothetical protein